MSVPVSRSLSRGRGRASWGVAGAVIACSAMALSAGCSASAAPPGETDPGSGGGDGELLAPEMAAFPPVLGALERRCATLDCHGDAGRNLRLYTGSGLRLDPKDVPGMGSTTAAEAEASYWSVVGLEPEELSLVVEQDGAHPERLTLVRKARGAEYHKPGAILELGDDADTCLTSWLADKLDEAACAKAAELSAPSPGAGAD